MPGQRKKVLTVGGAMLDSIAILDNEHIERMVMKNADTSFLLLEEGRKTEASEISTHCGGGAVNAAVSASRLGCDVSTLVKLGNDVRADQILSRLDEEKVSTRWVLRTDEAPTGSSVLISSHEKDAAIFTFRGANTLLRSEDLKPEMFDADLVYITGLSNESADCFPDLIRMARDAGAMVATNPGIRQLSMRGDHFHENLSNIDILSINRAEADSLLPSLVNRFSEGGPHLPLDPGEEPALLVARGFSSGGLQLTLKGFINALLDAGLQHVVITTGSAGAYVGSADGIRYCPVLASDVQGTAGAGDAFASTLSGTIAMGLPLDQALSFATINAASVVGHADTQTGLLSLKELQEREAAEKTKLAIRFWPT